MTTAPPRQVISASRSWKASAKQDEARPEAIRETWASIWLFRTYEERSYYKVEQSSVTMALLVHHSFPDEQANGVALTANPYDPQIKASAPPFGPW